MSAPAIYQSGKRFDQRPRTVGEIPQDADCWLASFQQGGFIKKYLGGEQCIAWRRAEPLGGEPIQDGFVIHHTMVDVGSPIEDQDLSGFNGWLYKQQSFTLSKNVELMEGVQKNVPSLVSFCAFDRGSFSGSDPLFAFHHIYGTTKVGGLAVDGEVSVAFRFFAVARENLKHKNIKCRSDGIDDRPNVACNQRIKRRIQISSEKFPISVIRIRLHDKLVWAAPLPGYESFLKDWDMGFGPADGVQRF